MLPVYIYTKWHTLYTVSRKNTSFYDNDTRTMREISDMNIPYQIAKEFNIPLDKHSRDEVGCMINSTYYYTMLNDQKHSPILYFLSCLGEKLT